MSSRSLGKPTEKPNSSSISTSQTKSKLQVKWPNKPKLKFKRFLRKKRGTSSSIDHTGIDVFKQVPSTEAIDGSNTELPSYFGMCGATENVTYRSISPQDQLLSKLEELKRQVHLLNEELEEVHFEKETALNMLMKTNTMLNPVQLEEIRTMLTIEGISTLSETIPFYARMCSCVDN